MCGWPAVEHKVKPTARYLLVGPYKQDTALPGCKLGEASAVKNWFEWVIRVPRV
eukprot:SAG11_NODE_19596_length_463_cov_0.969780_1_plen_53_part_01